MLILLGYDGFAWVHHALPSPGFQIACFFGGASIGANA
jgi:hypothetical protein